VRQAFLEWRDGPAEVRAGIQTFAWGKLDGRPPTDVVNPRDWHDPLVVDEFFEEQKIGIPALLAPTRSPTHLVSACGVSGCRSAGFPLPCRRGCAAARRWFLPASRSAPSVHPGNGGVGQTPCRDELPSVDLDTSNHAPARSWRTAASRARMGIVASCGLRPLPLHRSGDGADVALGVAFAARDRRPAFARSADDPHDA
jgi:hypothetical protein